MLDPSCHSKVDWPSQRAPQQARTPRHHLVRGTSSSRASCGRQAGFLLGAEEHVRSTHGWTRELQCLLLCIPVVQERYPGGLVVSSILCCAPTALQARGKGAWVLVWGWSCQCPSGWGGGGDGLCACTAEPRVTRAEYLAMIVACLSCLPLRPAVHLGSSRSNIRHSGELLGRDEPACRIQSVIWCLALHTHPMHPSGPGRLIEVLGSTHGSRAAPPRTHAGHCRQPCWSCTAAPCQVPRGRHSIVPRSLF